jgi:hypothetical protein
MKYMMKVMKEVFFGLKRIKSPFLFAARVNGIYI